MRHVEPLTLGTQVQFDTGLSKAAHQQKPQETNLEGAHSKCTPLGGQTLVESEASFAHRQWVTREAGKIKLPLRITCLETCLAIDGPEEDGGEEDRKHAHHHPHFFNLSSCIPAHTPCPQHNGG